jgi:hypothetical protein
MIFGMPDNNDLKDVNHKKGWPVWLSFFLSELHTLVRFVKRLPVCRAFNPSYAFCLLLCRK